MPPALTNMYTTNLTAYWQEVATVAGVAPGEAHLDELRVVYDRTGRVSQFRLSFVAGGSGGWRWYVLSQDDGPVRWQVEALANERITRVISVADALAQLQQVGAKRLTDHAGFAAPVRINLFPERTGGRYSAGTLLLDRGEIRQAGAEGARTAGLDASLLIQQDGGGATNKRYLVSGQ